MLITILTRVARKMTVPLIQYAKSCIRSQKANHTQEFPCDHLADAEYMQQPIPHPNHSIMKMVMIRKYGFCIQNHIMQTNNRSFFYYSVTQVNVQSNTIQDSVINLGRLQKITFNVKIHIKPCQVNTIFQNKQISEHKNLKEVVNEGQRTFR